MRCVLAAMVAAFVACGSARAGFMWQSITTIMILVLVATTTSAADRPSPYAQRVHQLLQEEQVDSALLISGPWGGDIRQQLMAQIQAAEKAGDFDKVLRLCEAFFGLIPFGEPYSQVDHKEWGDLVGTYLAVRKPKAIGAVPPEFVREEQAQALYQKILDLYGLAYRAGFNKDRFDECKPIVEQLVADYPETLYCRIGVATASRLPQGPATQVRTLEHILADLKSRNVTGRTRLFLLQTLADTCARQYGKPDFLRIAVQAYGEIIASTTHESERANSLILMATTAAGIDEETRAKSRRWFEEYWTKYPGARSADAARSGYVQTLINGQQFDAALEATASLRAKYPDWRGPAECRRQIAQAQLECGQRAAALMTFKGIVEDYPRTYSAAAAWATVAEIQRAGGDLVKERIALNRAVEPVRGIADGHDYRAHQSVNQAILRLSQITMQNEEWPIAIDLCLRRQWLHWCGTGMIEFEAANRRDINTCLEHLADDDPAKIAALRTLEERTAKKLNQVFP